MQSSVKKDIPLFPERFMGADAAPSFVRSTERDSHGKTSGFGVKDGANGLCAIIEEGAHAAYIDAEAGRRQTQYTHAWATFWTRG